MKCILPGLAFLLLATALCTPFAVAQEPATFILTADSLSGEYDALAFPVRWRYQPGDDLAYADTAYDDSDWSIVNTRLQADQEETAAWQGIGWFRIPVYVDSSMTDIPLGIRVMHYGAAEVYLNGNLLYASGKPGTTADNTQPFLQRTYHLFSVQQPGRLLLAVRYANPEMDTFQRTGWTGGFTGFIERDVNKLYADRLDLVQKARGYQFFFIGIYTGFALLHLILFSFYPRAREHLYFAILLTVCTLIAHFFHEHTFTTDPLFYVYRQNIFNTLGIGTALAALLFIYTIFYPRLPRYYFVILAGCTALLLALWMLPQLRTGIGLIVLLAACVEMLRVVVIGLVRRKPGARTIGFGILVLALSFGYVFLMEMRLLPQNEFTTVLPFFGVLGLIVMMSIFLSRNIALTNRNLREHIEQVELLSEQKLQQEVERQLLEAEYKVKLQELEEARTLQLSMLPESVPEHPSVELAAYMQTATEVGGDYYDFATDEDGTLTLAVGDATGHGMKAGTMVTATKSLFNALGQEPDLLRIFDRSTRALKRMNMRQLYMALTLAKYKNGLLRFATAGMPPTLVYRADTDEVEIFRLKGMPLGSFVNFPYQEEEISLSPGDTVLFMSDGFPELFNEAGDMLGYDQAAEVFRHSATLAATELVEHLVEEGRSWSNDTPPDDDITFVVLKVRS